MATFNVHSKIVELPTTLTKSGVPAIWCSFPIDPVNLSDSILFWFNQDGCIPSSIYTDVKDGFVDQLLVPNEGWYMVSSIRRGADDYGEFVHQVISIDEYVITLKFVDDYPEYLAEQFPLVNSLVNMTVSPIGVYPMIEKKPKPTNDIAAVHSAIKSQNDSDKFVRSQSNLAVLESSGVKFEYKEDARVALIRIKNQPMIDFYPSANKCLVSVPGKKATYMFGSAQDLIKWMKSKQYF